MNSFGKYPSLKENFLLRGYSEKGLTFCVYDWKEEELYVLTKEFFKVLNRCDGLTLEKNILKSSSEKNIFKAISRFGFVKSKNSAKKIERIQKYRFANNPFVRNVCWLITGHCNLKCKHCYIEAPSGRYGEPSFSQVKEIIEEFGKANVLSVQISGGEAFLRKDFNKIIDLLNE
ncbi:MAG: radical SAM protein, partial [Candidatus Diapherotrites archaeon]